jgi:hypothetical protein
MPCDLAILSITQTPSLVSAGRWDITLDLQSSSPPIQREFIAGPDPGVIQDADAGQSVSYNMASGTWTLKLTDQAGCSLTHVFKVGPVYGCTDPDADNYDPTATTDNDSCTYTQRLALATDLPELAPLGVPLAVVLTSAAVAGAVPAPASCLLDLSTLGATAGVQVRVDGYLFTSGPVIVPGRFTDATTLLAELRAQPVLAAAYLLTQPSPTQVLVTARTPGLPGAPTVTTSKPDRVSAAPTAGAAALQSQRRYRWGCYVEIWAGCGSVFGGQVDKTTAKLAQRLPLDYRATNRYEFDIAPALRGFTGHAYPVADGSCPDRLVSYFLRFGEEFADVATGLRRVRSTYESAVAWGLEAMELPAPVAGLRVLSARPQPWPVAVGDPLPVWLLGKPGATALAALRYRLATSRATTDVALAHAVATGAVTRTPNALGVPVGALSGELRVGDAVLGTLAFGATGYRLTFVNRQGGKDPVYFAGSKDDNSKRTATGFTNSDGAQQLGAEMALPVRLYSRLLAYDVWDWLRRELGTSPRAWLTTPAGEVEVSITDVGVESDAIKQEYSLYVDYQTDPVRGLSN